jgi:RNA polymerase sigma factor (sigma-70 family)
LAIGCSYKGELATKIEESMAGGKLSDVLHRMRILERVRALRRQGDGALLERFVADKDEAAFEVLVQRHGPMVLGVSRRILANGHDAEDAFQATFLMLACRASTIRNPGAVGAWLHAVACQVAERARKARSRRNRVQVLTGCDVGQSGDEAAARLGWRELRPVLDEELGRLPEKYRAPVVLCYLEERSNAEAAEQLGWPVGTVKGRLARARSLLQTRLARRGVALGSGLFVTAGAARAALGAAVPPALAATTVCQAMRVALGEAPAAAGATPAVAALFKGGLQTMIAAKVKVVAALLAVLGVCAFSGVFTYGVLAGREPGRTSEARTAPQDKDKAPQDKDKEKSDKKADTGSTEPAGVSLTAKLVGAKESYTLDIGGMSAEEFRKFVNDSAKGPRGGRSPFPASPQVDLKLELTNTGKEEIKVQVRGNANKTTLDLKGTGAFYAPIIPQNFLPVRKPPEVITIAPGKSITLTEIPTLAFPKPGTGSQAYWTAPGEYTLVVDYILGVSPVPEGTKDAGDGFGPVTIHSAPLTLKVVEPKK